MNITHELFASPDWHPLHVDFERQVITFVRISQTAYREYVYLGIDSAERRGARFYEIRFDDVLLAAANAPIIPRPVHYILHTAFCCSTLLARYFEVLSSCFVIKEPRILAELGLTLYDSVPQWESMFQLSLRLLARTYPSQDLVIIKTHVPSNILGKKLLDYSEQTNITFVLCPLRDFLLATLKRDDRKGRVRFWNRHSATLTARRIPELADINPDDLADANAVAYWWLVNSFLCRELLSSGHGARVMAIDGSQLADSPESILPLVMRHSGLLLVERQVESLVTHDSAKRHSKDTSLLYDANSRRLEMRDLENLYGKEVDEAVDWAAARGMGHKIHGSFTSV
jgi:hypothetical protein